MQLIAHAPRRGIGGRRVMRENIVSKLVHELSACTRTQAHRISPYPRRPILPLDVPNCRPTPSPLPSQGARRRAMLCAPVLAALYVRPILARALVPCTDSGPTMKVEDDKLPDPSASPHPQ